MIGTSLGYSLAKRQIMKQLKFYFAFILLALTSQFSNAQIKGNGQLETRAFDMTGIEQIVFNVTVNAEIDLSRSDELFVSVDENLFNHLIIEKRGNTLHVDQKDWIQSKKNINIVFGAQGLKKLTNTAWGNIKLINVDQDSFNAQMNVGSLQMEGKVETITVSTNAGKVDLSQLKAGKANATIEGNGRIVLNADKIDYAGHGFGQLIYLGMPKLQEKSANTDFSVVSQADYKHQASMPIEFVDVKLKNNTARRKNIRFRGPSEKPFGYGTPIGAKAVKHEKFPVGTRIYQTNSTGKDKLLLTITKENAGQTLQLFKN